MKVVAEENCIVYLILIAILVYGNGSGLWKDCQGGDMWVLRVKVYRVTLKVAVLGKYWWC